MAGVSYFPAERVALEAGYRYLDGGDIGAENGFDPDTISHALNLGVRVYFGD
jgi:opacity protein-like surface antigen